MNKSMRLFLVFIVSCMLLSACSNINPLAPPSFQNQEIEYTNSQNGYIEDIDNMLNENEALTDEKADDYSDQFKNKTDSIYYNAVDNFAKRSNKDDKGPLLQSILRDFYTTYNDIRLVSPVIFIVSIVFGVVGMLFSKFNKGAKRFFLVSFVIVIPLLLVIFIFGIGFLNSMFIYN